MLVARHGKHCSTKSCSVEYTCTGPVVQSWSELCHACIQHIADEMPHQVVGQANLVHVGIIHSSYILEKLTEKLYSMKLKEKASSGTWNFTTS